MPNKIPLNSLLARLPAKEHDRIMDRCQPVDMVLDASLCEPGQPFQHVYFPRNGFISLLMVVEGHPPLEMGLIGNEGMLGVTLVLGVETAPLLGVVQGPGLAWRMSTKQFHHCLQDSPALLRRLNRYLYVLMAQLSQTAACTHFHDVRERLARWLLMTHDRAHADHFHLTHQYLADMIGVQRSAVTIAAGKLQQGKLIRYTRGEIQILNRRGLEAASCDCYGILTRDYTAIFPLLPTS